LAVWTISSAPQAGLDISSATTVKTRSVTISRDGRAARIGDAARARSSCGEDLARDTTEAQQLVFDPDGVYDVAFSERMALRSPS
jgi:hypothetical protein